MHIAARCGVLLYVDNIQRLPPLLLDADLIASFAVDREGYRVASSRSPMNSQIKAKWRKRRVFLHHLDGSCDDIAFLSDFILPASRKYRFDCLLQRIEDRTRQPFSAKHYCARRSHRRFPMIPRPKTVSRNAVRRGCVSCT